MLLQDDNRDFEDSSMYHSTENLTNVQHASTPKRGGRIEYVYWNDINELKERLQYMEAQQKAGNDNVENEIIHIKEELNEENSRYINDARQVWAV